MTNLSAPGTRCIYVHHRPIAVDPEGYLLDRDDWSEEFAAALAEEEGLALTGEHWEVIRFLRNHHEQHGKQAAVHVMIKHFRQIWGPERGNNRYLHDIFPRGGPQKQGNRLAGIQRTRGEH